MRPSCTPSSHLASEATGLLPFSHMYHQQQGNPRLSVPIIDHREVDLWKLKHEVNQRGGYNDVRLHLPSGRDEALELTFHPRRPVGLEGEALA